VLLSVNEFGLRRAAHVTAVAAVMLCFSCNYGEVVVVAPAAVGHGPLVLSIQADPEDGAVARELRWSRGISGAEVTVSPADADTAAGPPVAVLRTDSTGTASVPDLPDGQYFIDVGRLLTTAEMAGLTPGDDAVGFMARAVVKRGPVTLQVPASHRRSVVISEWSFNGEYDRANKYGDYNFGGYLELANNADTTIYLDGLVVGMAYAQSSEYAQLSCVQAESFSNDPDGVWARQFDSLPGTGHTYPLAPGATAVIATDAIDHSAIWPGALDLSHADFEFVGTADADNPSVPNTISIGMGSNLLGHGIILSNSGIVAFVALPLDVAPLPRQRLPTTGTEYARVPRAKILDVVALLSTLTFTPCPHLVHNNFDRRPARMMSDDYSDVITSVNRKVAYTRSDGRKILQHTRTAAVDFIRGPRTPGRLP